MQGVICFYVSNNVRPRLEANAQLERSFISGLGERKKKKKKKTKEKEKTM